MTINHIGFDPPPSGLMAVIHRCDHASRTIWILDPFTGQELPYDSLSASDLVIIYTHEAAAHQWFDLLLPRLHLDCGLPWNNIAIYSGCLWDPDSPVWIIPNTIDEMSDFLGRFPNRRSPQAYATDHHYVCLNRLARWQRTRLVTELLDHGLDKFGRMSHPAVAGDPRFPLVLDRPEPTWADGYDIDFNDLCHAAVNVITESCYESEPGTGIYESHPRPGISEKTFKSWIHGQFPIWLAPYSTVSCIRDLGFDVFDDVIDHGYDLEPDPLQRIDLVIGSVEKVCGQDLDRWQDLRMAMGQRFQKNLDRLWQFNHNHNLLLPKWQQWFDQIR